MVVLKHTFSFGFLHSLRYTQLAQYLGCPGGSSKSFVSTTVFSSEFAKGKSSVWKTLLYFLRAPTELFYLVFLDLFSSCSISW